MFIKSPQFAADRLISEYAAHKNIIIGVDFDDTIDDSVHNRGNTSIPYIVYVLGKLQKEYNCTLCVWTANQNKDKVVNRWNELGLRIDYYNESPLSKKFPGPKPYFNVLLDDRAGLDSSFWQVETLLRYLEGEVPDDGNEQWG